MCIHISVLRQLLHEVQQGLTQTRARSVELTSRYLSPLVQELGKLQANKILRGDYDLKIARQDYFVSKQDQVSINVNYMKIFGTIACRSVSTSLVFMRYEKYMKSCSNKIVTNLCRLVTTC